MTALWSKTPRWLLQVVQTWGVLLVVGLVVTSTSSTNSLYTWTSCAIYAIFALGANVLFGWGGSASFGQAAYFGTGAYTVALLRHHTVSPLLLVLTGTVAALAIAVVFGVLTLRATGLRFAILTLVAAQLLYLLVFRSTKLGSETGLYPVLRGTAFGTSLEPQKHFFWFVLAVLAVVALVLLRIYQSSFGAALAAVRDDAARAAALGLPVRKLGLLAFTLAGAAAGAAGSLFAAQQGSASPSMLAFTLSGTVVLMCLLGGRHSFWGPVLGATVFTWSQRLLTVHAKAPDLWLGLLLLAIVLLMPEGLVQLRQLVRGRIGRRPPPPGAVATPEALRPAEVHP
ncbi:MAG: hypothetical protein JWP14_3517 [Frankiales bacterium]|nr:hypothetical protein [Frankiales bacterium]